MTALPAPSDFVARAHAPRIADIQAAVCRRFHLSLAEMVGDSRSRELARPRQVAMYLAHRLSCRSISEIAPLFNRDRATILHGRRIVQRLLDQDDELKAVAEDLERELAATCPCARCVADRGRFAMDPPQLVLPINSTSELRLEQVAA